MEIKKGKRVLILDLLIILILGFLSLTWFRGNNLISGGDFGMPLDWVKYLRLMRFIWDETMSFGNADYRQVASLIPYALTGAFLQSLGFSLIFIEKFLFYIWFTASGLSMYYLCYVLNMRRPGKLLASIFYMFNLFSLIIIWRPSHGLIQMPYAFAPLVLGMYIRGLRLGCHPEFILGSEKMLKQVQHNGYQITSRVLKHIILANFVWLFTTGSAYANPRMAIIHWLPILFYFFWALIFQKKQRVFVLKYTFSFLIFWLFLNFYWLLPFVSSLRESTASAHLPFLMPDLDQIKLTSVKFLEAIRMLGYWSMKSGYKGEPYYPYYQFYDRLSIKLVSWLIPILVILGFLHKNARKRPLVPFFLSLIIFGLLGTSSAYSPIGKYVMKFYGLFPPLALLTRFNFLFFGLPVYLIFSVLIGFASLTIYEYGFKKIGYFILTPLIILMILLTVVLVFPFWTGEVIKARGKLFPGERFRVPDYWWEAKKWLAEQEDFFRILPLPMSKTYNVAFDWEEGYSGGDPTRWLTNQPVLNVNTQDTFQVPMLIGAAIEREIKFKDIAKLLGFLNTRYLLIRNDSRWQFLQGHGWWFNHNPENMEKFAQNQNNLSLEKTIGKLAFYRLKDDYLLPHIYAPSFVTFIDGGIGSFLDIAQFLQPEKKEGIILFQQNPEKRFSQGPDFIWRLPSAFETKKKDEPPKAVYDVHIQAEGKYEVLLRENGSLKFYQTKKPFKIQVDEGPLEERTPLLTEDNLFSLGEIELTKNKHVITIFLPSVINLVDNSSFEEAGEFEQSTDAFKGDYALNLTAASEKNIFSIPINGFKVGENYKVIFATKHLQGYPAILVIWENYNESTVPVFTETRDSPFGVAEAQTSFSLLEVLPPPSWKEAQLTLTPNLYAKTIGLSFVCSPQVNKEGAIIGPTENLFDDLKVQRVFDNPILLRPLFKERQFLAPPETSFKKISPVKYEIEVVGAKKPYLLVFSEAFHPGWTLSVEAEHLMVNGFANGWVIKETGDYGMTLYFTPQKVYYPGAGVSLLAMISSAAYLGIGSKFKKQKKGEAFKKK